MRSPLRALLPATLALVCGCREGTDTRSSDEPIALSLYGANGCLGDDQAFGSLAAVTLAVLDVGPRSQLAAAADTLALNGMVELYATGAGATLVKLVFDPSDPLTPLSETLLLAPGDVDLLPEYASIAAPAELSGLAVLLPGFLVVVEESGNTLLLVSRDTPGAVDVLPGLVPDGSAGFADGTGPLMRFSFGSGAGVLATGDGTLLVADRGNHAIRLVDVSGLPASLTLAGTGAAFFADGSLGAVGFDAPSGMTLGCDGRLVIADTGGAGAGGNRLRELSLGGFDGSGQLAGRVRTLVGDGSALSTDGVGPAAGAGGPVAPVTTAQDEIYWIDSATGVLRRYDRASGVADCPLFPDCATATASLGSAPNFTSVGGAFSLARTEDGSLYALDADADELWVVLP